MRRFCPFDVYCEKINKRAKYIHFKNVHIEIPAETKRTLLICAKNLDDKKEFLKR